MAKTLIIKELLPENSREVARLVAPHVVVGREAGLGLVLPVEGVSRIHGSFVQGETFWLYADEGSTNGSWLNGQRLTALRWQVLRSGDLLQLANMMLQVVEEGGATKATKSLVAVDLQGVHAEFRVPEQGVALVLGGQSGDLAVDDSDFVDPLATFEVRDGSLCLIRHRNETPVVINGVEVEELSTIGDNDCIQVGHFQIVCADPGVPREVIPNDKPQQAIPVTPPPRSLRGESTGEFSVRTIAKTHGVFGMQFEEGGTTATQAVTPEQLAQVRLGQDRVAAARAEAEQEKSRFARIEDTIILVLSVGLIGVLLGFGTWWFMK
jgi:pSer/pThr/pTyr-binding forkhead associated (FHA) protein